jgi:hypothetical protein
MQFQETLAGLQRGIGVFRDIALAVARRSPITTMDGASPSSRASVSALRMTATLPPGTSAATGSLSFLCHWTNHSPKSGRQSVPCGFGQGTKANVAHPTLE